MSTAPPPATRTSATPRLLIPTRNRPVSLSQVLGFLDRFFPGTQVIIADGSSEAMKPRNCDAAGAVKAIAVDYRAYPYDLGFFDRILDVLEGLDDDLIIMGSDDDYPMLDVLGEIARFMAAHPDYATGLGALVHLRLDGPDKLTARLGIARELSQPGAVERMKAFAAWPFSTTYAVTRRRLLLQRYRRARQLFVSGFFDFAVGLQDCAEGKMFALPKLAFLCTRNFRHSYLRQDSRLAFLRYSQDLLTLVGQCQGDLMRVDGLGEEDAATLAETFYGGRIADVCGRSPQRMEGFAQSPLYRDSSVQQQMRLFADLFSAGTAARRGLEDRIDHIRTAMTRDELAEDNAGERKTYQSLAQQMEG